jgi:4'-phosphopantetheinyl transferase
MIEAVREGDAHVWIVPLDEAPPPSETDTACLSAAEREKAHAIVDPLMKQRYILTRIAQRCLLGACTRTPPHRLELRRSTRGKPFIAARAGIDFSLSHSRGTALLAVARTAVGIDIEHVRRPLHLDRTASRILHEETVALLESLDEADRTAAFIGAWTLREAHVKAVGGGLFRTPDLLPFDHAMPDDGALRPLRARDGEAWCIARFAPDAETRAAIVLRGTTATLHIHDATDTLTRIRESLHAAT